MARVRSVTPADAKAWLRLRRALWPDGSSAEHRGEIDAYLAGRATEPQAVLVAEGEKGRIVGFAELSIRPCAEGCRTDRVAYLEGWYVAPAARRHGVGRALVAAAEIWAREQGCTEFASDVRPDNDVGVVAHERVGFEDAGMIRCWRKEL